MSAYKSYAADFTERSYTLGQSAYEQCLWKHLIHTYLLTTLRNVEVHVLDPTLFAHRTNDEPSYYYKTYFITPLGAIKFDTTGSTFMKEAVARQYIAQHRYMVRMTPKAVFRNWRKFKPFEDKEVELSLIKRWIKK
jgi:hypothetical protein